MGEISLDVSVANRFISSLSKSLQALCHGCMDFDSGIEIIGYINVNIDSGSKVDYVLNEKVQKSRDNSMTFVSNSFLAKKDKAKQHRDGTCSPVPELQQSFSYSSHSGSYNQSAYPPYYQSQVLRGAHKRQWSGRDREWRTSQRKYSRKSHTASRNQSFDSNSAHNSSASFPSPQSSHLPSAQSSSNEYSHSEVKVKLESYNDSDSQALTQANEESSQNVEDSSAPSGNLPEGIKSDPDYVQGNQGEDVAAESVRSPGADFLHEKARKAQESSFPGGSEAGDQSSFGTQPVDPSNHSYSENAPSGFDQSYDNTGGDNSDLTVSFGETGGDMSSYPRTSFGDQGETSGDGANFECIEIGDDEEEEFQAIFGDNREAPQYHSQRWHSHRAPSPPLDSTLRFVCRLCGRGFTRRYDLKRHHIVHLDEGEKKVFVCGYSGCLSRYSRSDHLYKHQWVKHGVVRPSKQRPEPFH